MDDQEKLLWEASKVWCPDVGPDAPRRASTERKMQAPVENRVELVSNLLKAGEAGNPGYVSTYSFPRGHTDEGNNIPDVNTIFVDFDIPATSEYRSGDGHPLDAWKRSMSELLVRVRMVASELLKSGKAKHWRASLSGHKGVHLFFDFETISPANGSYTQFKRGLKEYGEAMINQLDEIAGGINIDPWVDVDSSDLARLVRHPNTPHTGAKHIAGQSWCVPVSIEELSEMTPEKYLGFTCGPRELPDESRTPSSEATAEISLKIRNATGSSSPSGGTGSYKDPKKLKAYSKESNDRISVSDIPLIVGKPCIMEFVERDDSYNYGAESRTMEINVMKELISNSVPIDVIVNFFRPIDGWNESDTRDLVEDLISRYDGPFVCKNIWDHAPRFCTAMNGGDCGIYDMEHDT